MQVNPLTLCEKNTEYLKRGANHIPSILLTLIQKCSDVNKRLFDVGKT